MFLSLVRVPSMKVSTAVLGSLFLYDVFWVFYSQNFFGENVMFAPLIFSLRCRGGGGGGLSPSVARLTVATRVNENPAAVVAQKLQLDAFVSPSMQLPVKLILGPFMLGLGDIVAPGLLATFAMRFGHHKTGRSFDSPHYLVFLLG